MPKKIRVYELARELGLSSKEALDLATGLGIGVKSPSSSIEDAQADRVRRKADQDGLRRDTPPEESENIKASEAKPAAEPAKAVAPASPTERSDEPRPVSSPSSTVTRSSTTVRSTSSTSLPPVAPRPSQQSPRPQQSPGGSAASAARATPSTGAPRRDGGQTPPPRPSGTASGSGSATPPPPRSATGRPIPPPPRSMSGKPIPPPPGAGGRSAPQGRAGGAGRPGGGFSPRPGGGAGRPGGAPGAGGRPGGGGGFGGPRPAGAGGGGFGGPRPGGGYAGGGGGAGGFGGARPGGPPGQGGPPGGGGGRGGAFGRGGGRPPARKKKRRRNVEELEPIQNVQYVPSNAPVPNEEVIVERGSSAQDLGPKLNRSAADVVRFLMGQGEMVSATASLSDDAIELFAAEIGATIKLVDAGQEKEAELAAKYFEEEDESDAAQQTRPPVITVMGHVDHGKTSLLDRIRKTNVTAGEAGGITQHIGAYQVVHEGREITFIDTPGHEAFTAMRARGADVTDIVVLVVAADDGVMPQTVEAINHARAAQVPIIVAINKVDKPDSNPDRIMQQLSEHELVPEQWGGSTIMVPVSALKGEGIPELLEQLLLVADVEELTANPDGRARGFVLEGNLDVGRGPVATVIVQGGTLSVGDPVVAGAAWGKVRALIDYNGENIKSAGPSVPVLVLGLSDVPAAGDELRGTADEKTARTIGGARSHIARVSGFANRSTMQQVATTAAAGAKLEDLFEQIQRGETATLNLILRADVQGSLEALTESLRKLERDDVKVSFVQRAVGGITQGDVELAAASGATIIGFNVRPDRKAREMAEHAGVSIRLYEIIYRVIEDMQKAMLGLLAPEFEEVVTGEAEVREVFRVPKIGSIAGCFVRNGVITRGSKVRFLRDGVVIWKGAIQSLKRFKDDAREVQTGFECGIGLSDFQDLKPGDIIETYEDREIARTA